MSSFPPVCVTTSYNNKPDYMMDTFAQPHATHAIFKSHAALKWGSQRQRHFTARVLATRTTTTTTTT